MNRLQKDLSMISASMVTLLTLNVSNTNPAQASCGSATCFLSVGNQPAVQPKDLVRVDASYSYVPQKGPANRVAAVNIEGKAQILAEHHEFQTINQRMQLDVNYGVTDNVTLQLTVPVLFRQHDHRIEVGVAPAAPTGEPEKFDASGLGDVRAMAKYGFLPSLRSLMVLGVGVDFPTGDFEARNREGSIQEPTLQIGRGDYGVVGHVYQAYEVIPHTLNQFFSYTYEHTFENKFAYQFGDRHTISGGLNFQITPKITISGQVNWQYSKHDMFTSKLQLAGPVSAPMEIDLDALVRDRAVRNTGSSNLMFTPGLTLHLGENTSWYFYSQVPLAQDFNGGLEQGVSFLTGFTKSFSLGGED